MIVDDWRFTDAALSCFKKQIIKVSYISLCSPLFCLSRKVKTSLSSVWSHFELIFLSKEHFLQCVICKFMRGCPSKMSAKIAKIDLFLLVRKTSSLRQTPVRADTTENLRNVEMAMAISLQDYQVTKNMFWDHGLSQWDATNDKNVTKGLWFLQFVSFSIFCVQ